MVDPRGPRFGAWITSAVLGVVLVTHSVALLSAQALVFAAGAAFGLRYAPYGVLYRRLVAPRLTKSDPATLEAQAPPRFAQGVGTVCAVAGVAGYATHLPLLGDIATGAALVAALLNAAVGFCLGCEVYLAARSLAARSLAARSLAARSLAARSLAVQSLRAARTHDRVKEVSA
ncbi:MAG: DUF4395 domain-containing protein [Mycobacteriales bacterium]